MKYKRINEICNISRGKVKSKDYIKFTQLTARKNSMKYYRDKLLSFKKLKLKIKQK